MSLQPESTVQFIKDSQKAIKSNAVTSFLVLGGACASVFNGLIWNSALTGTLEALGVGAATFTVSQVLKSGEKMGSMSNQQVNKHLAKGAFLALGASIVGNIANLLPNSLAHIAHYPTSIFLFGGIIAAGEAVYQKIKRPKI